MGQKWPTENELEMPDLPWFNEEEGVQRLRETGKLEGICLLFNELYCSCFTMSCWFLL